jgi:hypothetical protein
VEARFGESSDTRVAWELSIRDFEMERNLEIPTRSNVVYRDTEEKCCSWQDALRTSYIEPVVVWHFIRSGLDEWFWLHRPVALHTVSVGREVKMEIPVKLKVDFLDGLAIGRRYL